MSKFARVRKRRYIEQKGLCHYCKIPMWDLMLETRKQAKVRLGLDGASKKEMRFRMSTAEHLIKQADGGGAGDNIVACCGRCNWNRHDANHIDYAGQK